MFLDFLGCLGLGCRARDPEQTQFYFEVLNTSLHGPSGSAGYPILGVANSPK